MSHPRARDVCGGMDWRAVKRLTASRWKTGAPPRKMQEANRSTSATLENRPACPAMPPSLQQFSSCTSPCTVPRRRPTSMPVGGMEDRISGGGRYWVEVMPSGAKISRRQNASRGSSASLSRSCPSTMNPISEYTARLSGAASSGMRKQASSNSARVEQRS